MMSHGVIAFVIVAISGALHLVLGVWDLGLYLLGLGCLQLIVAILYIEMFARESVSLAATMSKWGAKHNLDLVVGRNLTLACGILSLAGGIFFIAKGQTPPYYESQVGLEIMWGGLVMGLILGPLAILAYGFQYQERHFAFSVFFTVAVALSTFYIIGYLGGLLGMLAVFFVVLSNGEFLD